ncbi:MAG: helix-turn-helix transcriptional regulator [Gemmatimonadota bacterium]|nr:helix-turn-helix transcriptional regulator [Gemmatimonadota bacterium]
MDTIRLRIQEVREALGWSQRELAVAANVRQATISKVESGRGVNLKTLEKLANALNVDAGKLVVHKPPKPIKGAPSEPRG